MVALAFAFAAGCSAVTILKLANYLKRSDASVTGWTNKEWTLHAYTSALAALSSKDMPHQLQANLTLDLLLQPHEQGKIQCHQQLALPL